MQSAWCIKSALFLLQCHKSLQVTSVIMPRKFRHYRPKCSEKKRALYYIIRVNKKLARDDSSAIKVKFHLYYEKRGLNIPHWNRTELKSYIRRNARIMYCAHTVSNPFPSTIYGSRDWRLRHGWWASGKSATGSGKAGSARSFDRVCDIQCHEILQASFTRGCNEIDSALA